MKNVVFSLPGEALGTASSAVLLGDFNNWDIDKAIALKPHKDGTLKAKVKLEPGQTYEYRFLLNDGRWVNDWAAQSYVHKHHFGIDNSVITVEAEIPVEKKAKPRAAGKQKKTTSKTGKVAETVKNDLTKIEGIGPAIAKLLEQEGFHNFKDLSKATIKKLKGVLDTAGSKFAMHDPKSWPKQAKLAAAEKWEELEALQQELTGGK
ncbi:helix-hairpin-helix domain-containing protein [Niabella aurantiaca]|uniref:helix-hairpin-helix domain-containing protein n=1 Tax=Niabella aurantiaca TaxID=379900 RepID=UPI000381783A|nr:helix-hairpin-helix domain-containing protein [Niabella aurantiaca]